METEKQSVSLVLSDHSPKVDHSQKAAARKVNPLLDSMSLPEKEQPEVSRRNYDATEPRPSEPITVVRSLLPQPKITFLGSCYGVGYSVGYGVGSVSTHTSVRTYNVVDSTQSCKSSFSVF